MKLFIQFTRRRSFVAVAVATWVAGGMVSPIAAGETVESSPVEFNRDVRPILQAHCISCHGPDESDRQAGLRLDTREGATEDFGGYAAVVPGDAEASELMLRVLSDDPDARMPPIDHAEALSEQDVATLTRWINQGAEYQRHWSFVPPVAPELPAVGDSASDHAVDRFVERRLRHEGLRLGGIADPTRLMRRLCLDITGLPLVGQNDRTRSAIWRYQDDPTEANYAAVVDQLLAGDAYAEHWASMWMDLARYADTVGYSGDENRDIWPWRDWLIAAIASNQSYKDMSTEMIAGDLMPDATDDQILATAFHRNTLSNNEGGTDDEEFRVIAVKDRLSTTINTWMGLTVRCAECHSHKYDPVDHVQYHQMLDLFNQSADADRRDEEPKLEVVPRLDPAESKSLAAKIERLRSRLDQESPVWSVAEPGEMTSAAGSKLEAIGDGRVLATGRNPAIETYSVEYPLAAGQTLSAIRLEAIPHAAHDHRVGRSGEGAFILSQVRLEVRPRDESTPPRPVPWAAAAADFSQPNQSAETALRADVESKAHRQGWAVRHPVDGYGVHREAVFELAEPIVAPAPMVVTLHLRFDPPWAGLNLGCFRVSTTSVPDAADRYRRDDLEPVRREHDDLVRRRATPVRVPVMRAVDDSSRRQTFVMTRGNFRNPGDLVEGGLPSGFGRTDYPADRLGLAEWIFADDNPLTARVAVNRYWARLFGRGLVETEEDFGTQGIPPTHPELLDSLAVSLVDHDWDVRWLIREMVTSHTYRQSATATPAALRIDPNNRWLSRGPRNRLSAEVVRDQALAVSGLLSDKMYGPPVYPPSPIGTVVNAFTGGTAWPESTGPDRYRRALYTFYKRSAPHPLFETFDMATRDVCSMRRLRTNTPLQSFMTLNDVVFIEAARALAAKMIELNPELREISDPAVSTAPPSLAGAIEVGLRRAIGRPGTTEQTAALTELFAGQLPYYRSHLSKAAELTGTPADVDAVDAVDVAAGDRLAVHAAMTVVANVILNMDAFMNN